MDVWSTACVQSEIGGITSVSQAQWNALQAELLQEVARHLTNEDTSSMAATCSSWSSVHGVARSLRMQLTARLPPLQLHGLRSFPQAQKLTLHISSDPAALSRLEELVAMLTQPAMPAVTCLCLRNHLFSYCTQWDRGQVPSATQSSTGSVSREVCNTQSFKLGPAAAHGLNRLRSLSLSTFLPEGWSDIHTGMYMQAPGSPPGILPYILPHLNLCSALTTLHLRYVYGAATPAAMDPLLQHVTHAALPALRTLSISALNLMGEGVLSCLVQLSGLERLCIYGRTLHATPETLTTLARSLRRLTYLKLFTTAGLTEEDLAAFDSEEEGDVSAVEAEDAMQPSGPAAVPPGSVCMDLSGLSHVTWLMLPFHARMKPLICQLSQLGMLEQLYLQVLHFNSTALWHVLSTLPAACPRLSLLQLDAMALTPNTLGAITECKGLRRLILYGVDAYLSCPSALLRLTSLTGLQQLCVDVMEAAEPLVLAASIMQSLAVGLPHLSSLHLSSFNTPAPEVVPLTAFTQLTSLSLSLLDTAPAHRNYMLHTRMLPPRLEALALSRAVLLLHEPHAQGGDSHTMAHTPANNPHGAFQAFFAVGLPRAGAVLPLKHLWLRDSVCWPAAQLDPHRPMPGLYSDARGRGRGHAGTSQLYQEGSSASVPPDQDEGVGVSQASFVPANSRVQLHALPHLAVVLPQLIHCLPSLQSLVLLSTGQQADHVLCAAAGNSSAGERVLATGSATCMASRGRSPGCTGCQTAMVEQQASTYPQLDCLTRLTSLRLLGLPLIQAHLHAQLSSLARLDPLKHLLLCCSTPAAPGPDSESLYGRANQQTPPAGAMNTAASTPAAEVPGTENVELMMHEASAAHPVQAAGASPSATDSAGTDSLTGHAKHACIGLKDAGQTRGACGAEACWTPEVLRVLAPLTRLRTLWLGGDGMHMQPHDWAAAQCSMAAHAPQVAVKALEQEWFTRWPTPVGTCADEADPLEWWRLHGWRVL